MKIEILIRYNKVGLVAHPLGQVFFDAFAGVLLGLSMWVGEGLLSRHLAVSRKSARSVGHHDSRTG